MPSASASPSTRSATRPSAASAVSAAARAPPRRGRCRPCRAADRARPYASPGVLGTMASMNELPDWPPGTVCVLSTGGGPPHAIPVSTALRAGPRRVLLALAAGRETLARLRGEPRCALTVVAAGDVACTIHARAAVVAESLPGAQGIA